MTLPPDEIPLVERLLKAAEIKFEADYSWSQRPKRDFTEHGRLLLETLSRERMDAQCELNSAAFALAAHRKAKVEHE